LIRLKYFSTDEMRQAFLDFFRSKGHDILPSASLVPKDDPTLLWINAGMAPLKPYFSKQAIPANPRMANSQKCIRTNDIENVGRTARHHTFFEMLGNFSIADYFKEESLAWGWEFLTEVVGMPRERLWVTVHPDDDEARRIWTDIIGLPPERVVDDPDNFWDIGPGPCGPNSEIYFDQGEAFGCGSPDCAVGCDCDRYLEVWNHVFSQFNHNEDGSYTPLPGKNIDTGMSLERLTAVVQGVGSNFQIDIFQPIMQAISRLSGHPYEQRRPETMAFNVIADHIRAITFAISDGAMPSNEGRGYVIRRLLRRAVRFGKTLGLDQPFLYQLVHLVVEQMGEAYPEIKAKQAFVERVVQVEEERFHETLDDGVGLLNELLDKLQAAGQTELAGADAFRLYDTYGFPLDLTEEMARERGVSVDREGFEAEMGEQRRRARAARSDNEGDFGRQHPLADVAGGNVFIGYEFVSCPGQVLAIAQGDRLVPEVEAGQSADLLFDQTVFYAEAGGQVADQGWISGDGVRLRVTGVSRVAGDKILHQCVVEAGSVVVGDSLRLELDTAFRQAVRRAHSATHLLHRALQEVLGEHVHQAGSLVEADQLRFDFAHFGPLTPDEMREVELQVNRQVLGAHPVQAEEMSLEEAQAMGAIALFGEKYGAVVRVVSMGDYSVELCGGTHVRNTSEVGQLRLLGESGIGAGLRRVTAVTGEAAYRHALEQEQQLLNLAQRLKVGVSDAPHRLESILQALKQAEASVERLEARLAAREAEAFLDNARVVDGVKVIAQQVIARDMDSLRSIADTVKDKVKSGVIVLGAVTEGKVNLVAAVTDDLLPRKLHAGNLIRAVAQVTGGGGGGRPQMAQAGGKDPAKLGHALNLVVDLVRQQLGAAE
jgi:alanyl-tRNA synthetase